MSRQPRAWDPVSIAFWSIFVAVNLVLIVQPAFGQAGGMKSQVPLRQAVFLIPLLVLVANARRARSPAERWLWGALAAAIGVASATVLFHVTPRPDTFAVARGAGASLAILLTILALRADPAHREKSPFGQVPELGGTVAVVVGMLTYFVLTQSPTPDSESDSGLRLAHLFVALDFLVILEAARLWFANRSGGWRNFYGWLTGYAVSWLVAHSVSISAGSGTSGALQSSTSSLWDALWAVPAIPLFLAARCHAGTSESVTPPSARWQWHRRTTLISAFIFVCVHFSHDWFSTLDPSTRPLRELVLILTLFILGVLAIVEQSLLDREARRLIADREAVIRRSEEREYFLDSLIESAPLAIVVLDPEHRVTVCNSAFESLFQYERGEIIGKHLDPLITRSESVEEAHQLTRRVKNGRAVEATAKRYRKDGTAVTVELKGVPLAPKGELLGIFGVYQDISDRIEALRALRESEARYRTLVEHAPEAIVILDVEANRFVDCNQEATQLFGLSKAEVLERGPIDVSPEIQPNGLESAALFRQRIHQAITGVQEMFEWTHLNSRGEEVVCEIRLTRIPARGRTLMRGSIIDISERIDLQQQLRQAQRMEAVGQLAGGIAHDFNNLLTVITGYCNLLLERGDLPEEAREELGEIRRAGESASALTRQLLAFSRRQVMQPETVDLNSVVSAMEDMLARLVGEAVEISIDLDTRAGTVHIDPGQLEQVVLNLIVNARDALPSGGRIQVQTRTETFEPGSPDLPAELEPGRFVVLSIVDNGMGIERRTIDHIFEPFFTTKERGKGTGLGLSTVYGIVRQCGGQVTVESRVGEGARFEVYLPWTGEVTVEEPKAVAKIGTGRPVETILVVEDEPMVRELTRTVLADTGFEVLTAANSDEAISLAEVHGEHIDLLLTDVVLPGLNGREIAERLLPRVPNMKVLYMSGYTDDLINDKGVLGSGIPFLHKPFTPTGLVLKVREALDTSQVEDA